MAFGIFALIAGSGVLISDAPVLARAIHLLAFGVAFLVPARSIGSPMDVVRRWRLVLACVLVATIAWDVAMAEVAGSRRFLMDWPIVYGSSVLTFSALLCFHGFVVGWVHSRTTAREQA